MRISLYRSLGAAMLALAVYPIPAFAHTATTTTAASWTLRSTDSAGRVQFEVSYSSSDPHQESTFGWSGDLGRADLAARLRGASGPIHFVIDRAAGTFDCSGIAGAGSGSGQFTFSPSPAFAAGLAQRGMDPPTTEQSMRLAVSNVTLASIDALPQHPRASITDILRAADRGVTPDFVRAVAAAGYPDLSLETLSRLRDHGVRAEFVQALAQRGYRDLSAEDLIRLADHGVTIAFIDRLQSHGYAHLSAEELVRLRDSGL